MVLEQDRNLDLHRRRQSGPPSAGCLDLLDANRALVLVLRARSSSRHPNWGRVSIEHRSLVVVPAASVHHVTDHRIEPRESANAAYAISRCGWRCRSISSGLGIDIDRFDLSDLLGRFGIDLIAERIEGERAVVDLSTSTCDSGRDSCSRRPAVAARGASATGGAVPPRNAQDIQWLRQDRFRRWPGHRAAAGDRQRRAGTTRRRTGLTGLSVMTSLRFVERLRDLVGDVDVVLSDIWGVVHNGLEAFPEACEALHRFRSQGGTVILITNAPRPADSVQRQLRKLASRTTTYDAIVCSGDLTRHFIADHPGRKSSGSARSATVRSIAASTPVVAPLEQADYIICTGLFDDETESRGRLSRDDDEGPRAPAAAGLRQSRHRGRARRPADLLRGRGRRALRRSRWRGDLLRQAVPADLSSAPSSPPSGAAAGGSTGCWRSATRCGPISRARMASGSTACS